MLTSDHNNNLPCVLVHAYIYMNEQECSYWRALRSRLFAAGFELVVLTHVPGDLCADRGFSFFLFKHSLDSFSGVEINHAVVPESLMNQVLERENLWTGKGNDTERENAVKFIYTAYSVLISQLNPALIVVGNGEHAAGLVLRAIANASKIKVVFMERGPFPLSYHLDEKGITAGTLAAAESRCWWLLDQQDPWLEVFDKYEAYYKKSGKTWWEQPAKNISLRSHFSIPSEKKIILFANQLDNDVSNFMFSPLFENNLSAFEWLCQSLRPFEDTIFIVGKHHPKNFHSPEPYEKAVKGLGIWLTDVPLGVCLKEADRIVAVNSTILYEALIMRIPVLMLGQAILSGKGIAYEIDEISGVNTERKIIDWLEGEKFRGRIARWRQLGACLLADCLFFSDQQVYDVGVKGGGAFADKLIPHVNPNRFPLTPQPVGFSCLLDYDHALTVTQKKCKMLQERLDRYTMNPLWRLAVRLRRVFLMLSRRKRKTCRHLF